MKSKSTVFWFMLAVALAAAIWVLDNYFQLAPTGAKPLLAGFHPDNVTNVEITPGGGRQVSVTRTNNTWFLEQPFAYPAQATAIDGMLDTLEKLKPVMSFSAGEMSARKNADAEFGFDNPQFTLGIVAGAQTWHVIVGNKTAPGDGVYVRIVGTTGAFVTETSWLQFLPRVADDWRDTTLVDVPDAVDSIVITNGTQAVELSRNITNRLWSMVRPLSARANNLLIVSALQQLRGAKVTKFVSDDPKADFASYGLDPAAVDVWLGTGTNLLSAVHIGKEVPHAAGEVYARRQGWNAVVSTPKEPLSPWRGTVNDFRDPNLLELTAPVAEIEVQGDSNFTLQQHGPNAWAVAGEKFPVDADEVTRFIKTLAGLQITIVQDVVTAAGLQSYGLASPSREITLRSAVGDTNSVIAQLLFGNSTNNQVYVKRSDENFVYALPLDSFNQLSRPSGDFFRTRQVWSFSETNVAQVTLQQNGKTRQLVRRGPNDWSLAAGQGVIEPHAIEETIHRLGNLNAVVWWGRKFTDADMGLTTNSLSVTVELKSGEKYSVSFGGEVRVSGSSTAKAVATLDGQRWAFVFPPVLCPYINDYLTVPPVAP